MIRLSESVSMAWLGDLGVAVPRCVHGADCIDRSASDTESVTQSLGFGPPWVVKPDVAVGGKGLRGLVRICSVESELPGVIREMTAVTRDELGSERLLIEEYIEGVERYISIAMDEEQRAPVLRVSTGGGVGFQADRAQQVSLQPGAQTPDHVVNQLLDVAGLTDRRERLAILDLASRLTTAFMVSEATLLEINPVRWTGDRAVAVGVACEFDADGRSVAWGFRPREPEGTSWSATPVTGSTERERAVAAANAAEAHLPSVSFIEVGKGDVALLVSGGGGSLLCFDYLSERGFRPACYMDSSPGAGVRKRTAALRAGLSVPGIRGALIGSVVVSLADVTESSTALINALEHSGWDPEGLPIVLRLAGPNEEAARSAMRAKAPAVHVVGRDHSLEDCCDLLISLIKDTEEETVA